MEAELREDLGKAHFQQELNRWFESKGIISDLRSHLRHLMITALQNTQIGLKPSDKTSPKSQALNLIVAEYLFRHGCHYTLSVFTSEVPTLANFSTINPGVMKRGIKSSEIIKKYCFQEKELEEISNALGMTSSSEELENLKSRYFQKGSESSLIEVFFQFFIETSTKLQIRKTLESYEVDEVRKVLSEKWSTKVVDILLNENIKSAQIAAIKHAISRITESEVNKIIQEERRMQMQGLAEREKRIQEYLRRHEEDIFNRLMDAEKDLNERKEMIDEELTDRQKQLTEMALEWNEKHEEILKLSKNFHGIENENLRLQKKIEKLEKENENFKREDVSQRKTIEELENERNLLIDRVKELTDAYERIQVQMENKNKEVPASHSPEEENVKKNPEQSPNFRPSDNVSDKKTNKGRKEYDEAEQKLHVKITSPLHEYNAIQLNKSHLGSGDTNQNLNIDLSEDEIDSSSSCDKIISSVRKNLQALEEQSNRINKNYLDYKLKCKDFNSDSETSIICSDKSLEKVYSPIVIKESRFCQTVSPDLEVENFLKKQEQKKHCDEVKKSVNIIVKKCDMLTPTKRQLQNREFFLKSRQLLQELEKQTFEELTSEVPSVIESLQNSSDEIENLESIRECVKSSSKASLHCNKEPDEVSRKKVATEIRLHSLPNDDEACLALLEETRIKSPQEVSRKTLRQHVLQLESDSNDEKEKSKEEKSNKSPNFLMSTPTIQSGRVSVGRKSGSDDVW